MRKYLLIMIALVSSAFIAGCGTKASTSESKSGITTVKIASTDILNNNLFLKSIENNFQLDSIASATSTGTLTGTATDPRTGSWQFSETDGTITVTDDKPGSPHTFIGIQKETLYYLVYDSDTKVVSRLYLNATNAAGFDPTLMGGAKQGTPLNLTVPTAVNVSTFAGSTLGTSGADNATIGTDAKFSRPLGITTDGTNFYVTDYNNKVIRKISSTGEVSPFDVTKAGTAFLFNQPNGITCDGQNLYVADSANHAIYKIVILDGKATVIAGTEGIAGNKDNANETSASAAFNTPIGITTDGTNLYVADSGNNTIRKIVLSSSTTPGPFNAVSTIAGNIAGVGKDDGTSTAARFNLPTRLTTDGSNLYVTDFKNRTIRKVVIATGEVSTLAGNPEAAPLSKEGTGITATFYHLGGITTDGTDLYITEFNDTIESEPNWISLVSKAVISANGKTATVTRIAGGSVNVVVPTANEIVDDTLGTDKARFVTPIGITTNGSGLYVTDGAFNNIRMLQKFIN